MFLCNAFKVYNTMQCFPMFKPMFLNQVNGLHQGEQNFGKGELTARDEPVQGESLPTVEGDQTEFIKIHFL